MGKRKESKKQVTKGLSLENPALLSILGLIVAVIGLYLASRANKIALQQNESNVVVLNMWNTGYDFENTVAPVVLLACVERVRFSNLGNASDSIVGYDTIVHYQNTQSVFESSSGMATNQYSLSSPPSSRTTYTTSNELRSAIDRLAIKIAPSFAFGNQRSSITGNVESVTFPYAIEGFTTLDLEMSIVYGVVSGNAFNMFYEEGQPLFTSQPTNLAPLEFEIHFKLSSGATAKTPRINCGAIGIEQIVAEPPTPFPISNSSFSSIVMDPPSPSEMKLDQRVNIAFNYKTDETSGVRIWAFPHFAKQSVPEEFATNPSPIYPIGTGNAHAYINVSSGEATIDKIILQMWDADQTTLLYETELRVNYHYRD